MADSGLKIRSLRICAPERLCRCDFRKGLPFRDRPGQFFLAQSAKTSQNGVREDGMGSPRRKAAGLAHIGTTEPPGHLSARL